MTKNERIVSKLSIRWLQSRDDQQIQIKVIAIVIYGTHINILFIMSFFSRSLHSLISVGGN